MKFLKSNKAKDAKPINQSNKLPLGIMASGSKQHSDEPDFLTLHISRLKAQLHCSLEGITSSQTVQNPPFSCVLAFSKLCHNSTTNQCKNVLMFCQDLKYEFLYLLTPDSFWCEPPRLLYKDGLKNHFETMPKMVKIYKFYCISKGKLPQQRSNFRQEGFFLQPAKLKTLILWPGTSNYWWSILSIYQQKK